MNRITLNGWVPGFQTIAFIHALRAHCGYDLTRSKQIVDQLLGGDVIIVHAASETDAAELLEAAQLFGAKAENTVD
jgi:hypothetical protein